MEKWNPSLSVAQFGGNGAMFQFQVLCSIVSLKMRQLGLATVCHASDHTHLHAGNVYKISRPRAVVENSTMVFASSPYAGAVYTQVYEKLLACPYDELRHYVPFFGLEREEMNELRAHIKFWDILRVCCHQLPSDLRRLHGCKRHQQRTPLLANPRCEIYDLIEVDRVHAVNSKLYNLTIDMHDQSLRL